MGLSRVLLTLIGAIAILAPGWLVWRSPSLSITELQAMAESSCRCARKAGPSGKAECWRNFEASAGRFGPLGERIPYACAGVVPNQRCFENGDCVTTGYYSYEGMFGPGEDAFCSPAEAAEAQAVVYAMPMDQPIDPAPLRRLQRDFITGRRVAGATTPGGCGA